MSRDAGVMAGLRRESLHRELAELETVAHISPALVRRWRQTPRFVQAVREAAERPGRRTVRVADLLLDRVHKQWATDPYRFTVVYPEQLQAGEEEEDAGEASGDQRSNAQAGNDDAGGTNDG